jgi:hypothetical protein
MVTSASSCLTASAASIAERIPEVENSRASRRLRSELILEGCHMKFVLVNERSPRRQAFCVSCDEPIGAGYLREIGTHLTYCNHDCYERHCESAFLVLESRARAS